MKKIALTVQVGTFSRFEMLKEILDTFLKNFTVDLYLACYEQEDYFLKHYPTACILKTENLGTDIGMFLQTLKIIILTEKDYDYILKIHTKKPSRWTFDLLDLLNPLTFETVLKKLEEEKVGLVSKASSILPLLKHSRNMILIREILTKIGKEVSFPISLPAARKPDLEFIAQNPNCYGFKSLKAVQEFYYGHGYKFLFSSSESIKGPCFSAGTIFVAKASVFLKYFSLEIIDFFLTEMRYNQETGYFTDLEDAKWTHTLERFFGLISHLENLKVAGV